MNDDQLRAMTERLLDSDRVVASLGLDNDYKRSVWNDLDQQLEAFLADQKNRWLIISGLRGIGKTTLMTQLYGDPRIEAAGGRCFYLSLDDVSFGSLSIESLVEAIKRQRQRYPDSPLFLFLDEVHFEPQWSLACKLMFDRVQQLFLVCTGSSALNLKVGADSARRSVLIPAHPLSLAESLAINRLAGDQSPPAPDPSLSRKLQRALFYQPDSLAVYQQLAACQPQVDEYYRQLQEPASDQVDRLIDDYINGYKTLPLPAPTHPAGLEGVDLRQHQLSQNKNQINRVIRRLLTDDAIWFLNQAPPAAEAQLQSVSLARLPDLAVVLADGEGLSLTTMSKRLEIQVRTLKAMLPVLVAGGLITEIPPAGGGRLRSTKKSKYLFAAPALRQALLPSSPNRIDGNDYDGRLRGSLLEDTVSMYLQRLFDPQLSSSPRAVEYDSQKGGADFLVSPDGRHGSQTVAIEVGYQKKSSRQVGSSLKAGGRYGLVVTNQTRIGLDEKNSAVYVPLELFLLVI